MRAVWAAVGAAVLAPAMVACSQTPPRSRFHEKPCALVSKSEAETAMGEAVEPVSIPADPVSGAATCQYGGWTSGAVRVTLTFAESERVEDVWERWLVTGAELRGLGDKSAWKPRSAGDVFDNLYVVEGHWLLRLEIGNAAGPEDGQELAVKFAKAALARLREPVQPSPLR